MEYVIGRFVVGAIFGLIVWALMRLYDSANPTPEAGKRMIDRNRPGPAKDKHGHDGWM